MYMEKRANEFLVLSGQMYEENKRKWRNLVEGFNEDVYNDTILKVYEHILNGEDTGGDLIGYWFKSFKNNLNRHRNYAANKNKSEIDEKVRDKEDNETLTNIYYSTIRDILLSVRNRFDRKTFEVFRMYLLCNMSYEQLDNLTGVDSKERITRVRKWLNGKKNFR